MNKPCPICWSLQTKQKQLAKLLDEIEELKIQRRIYYTEIETIELELTQKEAEAEKLKETP